MEVPGTLLGAVRTGLKTTDRGTCLYRPHIAFFKAFRNESKHLQSVDMMNKLMFFPEWVKTQV